jgi:hypothetical protein
MWPFLLIFLVEKTMISFNVSNSTQASIMKPIQKCNHFGWFVKVFGTYFSTFSNHQLQWFFKFHNTYENQQLTNIYHCDIPQEYKSQEETNINIHVGHQAHNKINITRSMWMPWTRSTLFNWTMTRITPSFRRRPLRCIWNILMARMTKLTRSRKIWKLYNVWHLHQG